MFQFHFRNYVDSDQIPAELIKAGGSTIHCAIHKLIIAIWNKEDLPGEWKESIIVPIHKKGDKTDCNNYRHCFSTLLWNMPLREFR